MEQRFGIEQVCAVGTYTTLQLKAALTDLSKLYGVSIPTIRSISKRINGLDDKTIEDFLKLACRDGEVKSFVNKYPELINAIFLILGQPKAPSIHACAMMIFPNEKTLYEWCPVKKQKDMIVSEWEGGELDEAGFLKEDILGIEQLDKFTDILNLIEKNTGKRINLYKDIPLNDPEVFEFFKKGWLGDIFHFGAKGLSNYVTKVQPESIEDLIACICLYRPGPMENNYHNEFLLRRSGDRETEFPIGGEEILKDSFGLMLTQEHIMLLCQQLAGFSLQKADDVRKAMGKKIMEKIKSIRPDFVRGYVDKYSRKGVDEEYANDLWSKMEEFGKYAFNKSHAAAYSINGYNSLWLKVHYPIEFWSVTFSRASKDDYPFYINEIRQSGNIKLNPVDINKSSTNIAADKEDGSLYWSINSVNQVGEKAQEQIIKERGENGPYFSLEEFIDRHNFKNSAVNKSVIENLIYSGAFDELEQSTSYPNTYRLREYLLNTYRTVHKVKIDKDKDEYELALSKSKTREDWWWQLQQKKRSGFGFFNYEYLVDKYLSDRVDQGVFSDLKNIEEIADSYKIAMIGGYVLEYEEKNSRKGTFARIILESNYEIIKVIIYAEIFDRCKDLVRTSEKNILLVTGRIIWSDFDGCYVLQTLRNSEFVKLTLA